MAPAKAHPFSTTRGRAFRKRILIRDLFTCQMCGVLLREGKTDSRAAVVDHIKPIELCPDLTWDEGNCQATCAHCHNTACASIEVRHAGDAKTIAEKKLLHAPVGLDGYRIKR